MATMVRDKDGTERVAVMADDVTRVFETYLQNINPSDIKEPVVDYLKIKLLAFFCTGSAYLPLIKDLDDQNLHIEPVGGKRVEVNVVVRALVIEGLSL